MNEPFKERMKKSLCTFMEEANCPGEAEQLVAPYEELDANSICGGVDLAILNSIVDDFPSYQFSCSHPQDAKEILEEHGVDGPYVAVLDTPTMEAFLDGIADTDPHWKSADTLGLNLRALPPGFVGMYHDVSLWMNLEIPKGLMGGMFTWDTYKCDLFADQSSPSLINSDKLNITQADEGYQISFYLYLERIGIGCKFE